jgi:hypothetical protein
MPNLTGASEASTLRTEVLGDGRANCLERAVALAGPADSLVLVSDGQDGVGHALVRRPDGSIVDPNNPTVRYETLGQWLAMNPRYSNPVTVPAGQARQVLSMPPGRQRDELIARLGLSGVASRQVADGDTGLGWVRPLQAVTLRDGAGFGGAYLNLPPLYLDADLQVIGETVIDGESWLQVRTADGTEGWLQADKCQEMPAPPSSQPFPDWLVEGSRPPHVSAELWNHLPPDDQLLIIRQEREKVIAEAHPQPDWLRDGSRPPSIPGEQWDRFPPAHQQRFIESARAKWTAAILELAQAFFQPGGVPPEGIRLEEPLIGLGSSLGDGRSGDWARYASANTNAVQYLNLAEMFDPNWPDGPLTWRREHNNLCGPLAVGAALGLGPVEALTLFKGALGDGRLNDGEGTTPGELTDMLEQAGWSAAYASGDNQGYTRPWELADKLAQGQVLIALVNIDSNPEVGGMLTDFHDGRNAKAQVAHWVNIRAVEQGPDGQWLVRVYNPFQNSEEIYTWEAFKESWETTHNGADFNRSYGLLTATPPADA